MLFRSNKKDEKEEEEKTVELTPEQKANQMREERVSNTLGKRESLLKENPRLSLGTIPDDRQLVLSNRVNSEFSTLPQLSNLKTVQPIEYVTKWAALFSEHHWNNGELKELAFDALEGLISSLETDMPHQVELQVKCLVRALVRDHLEEVGFKSFEVRFEKRASFHDPKNWNRLPKTRTNLIEQTEEDEETGNFFYIMTGPEDVPQRMRMLTIDNSKVRTSGKAFRALKLLRQLPDGVVQDVWVAELLGPDRRINGESDPLLIVQIAGYSYALCEWTE